MAVAMVLSSRGKPQRNGPHEVTKILVGVGADIATDTGVFTVGKTDAAGYATGPTAPITDFICEDVVADPVTHAGRVFYRATFLQLVAG